MNLFELAIVLSAVDRATGPIRGVTQALDGVGRAGEKLQALGTKAVAAGALMTAAGAAIRRGFVGAIESVMTPANLVEDALNKVGTVVTPLSGTVEDAMGRMKTAAVSWSLAHTDGAAKFLDTTYMMISAGLNEAAAIEATRTAMLTAKATMGDSSAAAALIATIYNNMGDKSADAAVEIGRLGDVVTKTQQTFQFADLNQLSEGLKFGIPTALQYGIALEDLSAIIGQLNNAGLAGSMAGTAFGASMRGMEGASKALKFEIARTASGGVDFLGTLKGLEAKFGDLSSLTPEMQAKFQQAFGDEGWRGLSLLLGKSKELEKNLDLVKNSAGAAASAASKMGSSSTASWQIFENRVDALKMGIADRLAPALEQLAPSVLRVVDAIGVFLEQNPEVLDLISGAIIEMMQSATKLAPIIGDVAESVVGWMKENPGLTKGILQTVVAVGAVLTVVGPLLIAFGAVAAAVGAVVASATGIAIAAAGIAGVGFVLASVGAAAAALYVVWLALKWAFGAIVGAGAAAWNSLAALFTGLDLAALLSAAWGAVVGLATGTFTRVVDAVRTGISSLLSYLGSISLIDSGMRLLSTFTDGILSAASGPIEALKSVVGRLRDLLPFSPAKTGPLADLDRVRIVETVAESVRPAPLVAAMSAAAGAARAAIPPMVSDPILIPALAIPEVAPLAPMPLSAREAGARSSVDTPLGKVEVHLHFGGGTPRTEDLPQFEAWARANAGRLASMIAEEQRRRGRTDLKQ